ncbi:MAG: response regulator [Acidimicrobiales bacterium]
MLEATQAPPVVRRVLVVEDEPVIRRLLEETLAWDGVEVVLACNADEAMGHLGSQDFDVALVDLLLPRPTGWALLAALSAHPGWPRPIVVSAVATAANQARAFDLGALDVVSKPFDPMELLELVDRVARLAPHEVDAYRRAARARAYV